MSSTPFHFGNGICSDITVDAFTPVCSKPDVAGSTPLQLDVPVPVFAPVIPPQECVCFTFSDNPTTITVKMTPGNKTVASGSARVKIAPSVDCCDGVYTVEPAIDIVVPECMTPDAVLDEREVPLGANGYIKYKLTIKDCVPHLDITQKAPVQQFDGNINLCLGPSSFTVKATGRTEGGVARELASQDVDLTPGEGTGDYAGCMQYSIGDITLDLSALDFGNGGSVFRDADTNDLHTDGSTDSDKDTWYGGGLGDLGTDNHETGVLSRGPAMRGYTSPLGAGDHYVQYARQNFRITTDNGTKKQTVWYSSRKLDEGETMPAGATGNLNMVMPTGFQWHDRGLALNLCTFVWNPSGLLSQMAEVGYAALVSPAPSLHTSDAPNRNGQAVKDRNASGLCIYPTAAQSTIAPGLSVKDGHGLRIFGKDARTADAEITAAEVGANDRLGTLEVYAHNVDFGFNADGKLVLNDWKEAADPNLPAYGQHELDLMPYLNGDGATTVDTYRRGVDCTIPVVSANYDGSQYWAASDAGVMHYNSPGCTAHTEAAIGYRQAAQNSLAEIAGDVTTATNISKIISAVGSMLDAFNKLEDAIAYVNYGMGSLAIVQTHFGAAGMLIGADTTQGSQHIARHYKPTTA